jgi:hypothetical protein
LRYEQCFVLFYRDPKGPFQIASPTNRGIKFWSIDVLDLSQLAATLSTVLPATVQFGAGDVKTRDVLGFLASAASFGAVHRDHAIGSLSLDPVVSHSLRNVYAVVAPRSTLVVGSAPANQEPLDRFLCFALLTNLRRCYDCHSRVPAISGVRLDPAASTAGLFLALMKNQALRCPPAPGHAILCSDAGEMRVRV